MLNMELIISDDKCWKCGQVFGQGPLKRTTHHVIPRHLKPVKNMIIPIHEKCHDEITSQDVTSLTAFTFKLEREVNDIKRKVVTLTTLLNNFSVFKLTSKVKKK